MTLDQADSARRRAVRMYENFDDEAGAAEFDAMSPEEYADHKGIEIVSANPTPKARGLSARPHSTHWRKRKDMANKSQRVIELEDTIKDIYDIYQNSGTTRAELTEAWEKAANLCTEAMPELDEDEDEDEDEGDGDGDGNEEDEE